MLRSPEYCDLAPAQVWARLLDDGIYLCSISTMYRLLAVAGENRERRRQRTHPAAQEARADRHRGRTRCGRGTSPSCTGPTRGVYYELFVIIDIFSRYVVGLDGRRQPRPASSPKRSSPTALAAPRHRTRPAHPARRPGHVDDLQAGRPAARRPRRRPQPQPPPRVQRQPLLRGAVQDAQVLPGVPRPVRLDRTTPARSARRSSTTTTTSTATPASGCTPRPRSTTAPPPRSAPSAPSPSTPPTPPTPPGSATADPTPPKLPTVAWINEPTPEALIKNE